MKTVIAALIEAVKASPTVDAVQSLHPTLSPKKAAGILKDVSDHIEGTLSHEQLAMYLMNDGIQA